MRKSMRWLLFYSHFIKQKIEAQTGKVAYLRSNSLLVVKAGRDELRHLNVNLFAIVKGSKRKGVPEDTVKKKNCGWNRYKEILHCLFSWRTEHQSWLTRSGIIPSMRPNAMVYTLGCGPILVKWECSMASPYIPWVEARSPHSKLKRSNCPTTVTVRQHGRRRRKYSTPIQDIVTKCKIHAQFLFHKAAQEFCEIHPK